MLFEWVKMFTWPNNQTTHISFQVGFIIVGAITIWKVSHHSLYQALSVVGSLNMKPSIAPTLRVERMLSAPHTHTQQWFKRETMEDLP